MSDTKDDLGSELPGEVWHTAMRFTGLAAARRIVWLTKVWRRCKERMRRFEMTANNFRLAHKAVVATCDRLRDERDAARKEVEVLTLANELADVMPSDDLKPALDTMAKALDAKTREADELTAQRDAARTEADELRSQLRDTTTALECMKHATDELKAQRDRAEALCQEHATLIKQLEERLRQATQAVDRSTMPTVPPRVGYRYERRDGTTTDIVEDRGCSAFYQFVASDGQSYTAIGSCGFAASRSPLDLVREIGPIEQGDKS